MVHKIGVGVDGSHNCPKLASTASILLTSTMICYCNVHTKGHEPACDFTLSKPLQTLVPKLGFKPATLDGYVKIKYEHI